MDKKLPDYVQEIFGARLKELCSDRKQVEQLLQSSSEWERAGAVVIFATQFGLKAKDVKTKLEESLAVEESPIVKAPLLYHLSMLEAEMHFEEYNAELLEFAKSDLSAQLSRIQSGTRMEKLGAIRFAELVNSSDPSAAAEIFEHSLRDSDNEVRCAGQHAMSKPFVGTSDKVFGSALAKLALDPYEADEVRVCAAGRFLHVFKPVGLSRDGVRLIEPTFAELKANLLRMRKLIEFGVHGIDKEYIERCLDD